MEGERVGMTQEKYWEEKDRLIRLYHHASMRRKEFDAEMKRLDAYYLAHTEPYKPYEEKIK